MPRAATPAPLPPTTGTPTTAPGCPTAPATTPGCRTVQAPGSFPGQAPDVVAVPRPSSAHQGCFATSSSPVHTTQPGHTPTANHAPAGLPPRRFDDFVYSRRAAPTTSAATSVSPPPPVRLPCGAVPVSPMANHHRMTNRAKSGFCQPPCFMQQLCLLYYCARRPQLAPGYGGRVFCLTW
jgi:hypothetical protein